MTQDSRPIQAIDYATPSRLIKRQTHLYSIYGIDLGGGSCVALKVEATSIGNLCATLSDEGISPLLIAIAEDDVPELRPIDFWMTELEKSNNPSLLDELARLVKQCGKFQILQPIFCKSFQKEIPPPRGSVLLINQVATKIEQKLITPNMRFTGLGTVAALVGFLNCIPYIPVLYVLVTNTRQTNPTFQGLFLLIFIILPAVLQIVMALELNYRSRIGVITILIASIIATIGTFLMLAFLMINQSGELLKIYSLIVFVQLIANILLSMHALRAIRHT